eukprot:2583799-Lingulodinium_polyedra.AAC.1
MQAARVVGPQFRSSRGLGVGVVRGPLLFRDGAGRGRHQGETVAWPVARLVGYLRASITEQRLESV